MTYEKSTEDCSECGGRGYFDIVCPDCNGFPAKAEDDCWRCDNSGADEINCDLCDGSGQVVVD